MFVISIIVIIFPESTYFSPEFWKIFAKICNEESWALAQPCRGHSQKWAIIPLLSNALFIPCLLVDGMIFLPIVIVFTLRFVDGTPCAMKVACTV